MAHTGKRDMVDKPEGKNHLDNLGIDGRISLHCTLKKQGGNDVGWTHMAQQRQVMGFSEHSNESLGYTKCQEFLYCLRNY